MSTVSNQGSAAARKHGYEFGVDGVVDLKAACEMIANVSRTTIDRYVADGLIRKGKSIGRAVFCVRSIREYLKTLEQ